MEWNITANEKDAAYSPTRNGRSDSRVGVTRSARRFNKLRRRRHSVRELLRTQLLNYVGSGGGSGLHEGRQEEGANTSKDAALRLQVDLAAMTQRKRTGIEVATDSYTGRS